MTKVATKLTDDSKRGPSQWSVDQVTKTGLFRQQLHGLLTIATKIENIRGETLDWELSLLGISKQAWNKIIHGGIKPVIVFAHPFVLKRIPGAVGYYRMLSMVPQKSKDWTRLKADRYESGQVSRDEKMASAISKHLNRIISRLVELDEQIDAHEFDL